MNPDSDNALQVISRCNAALLFNMQQEFVLFPLTPDRSNRPTHTAMSAATHGGATR